MALTAESALRKDTTGGKFPAAMEHRHFAVIAGILPLSPAFCAIFAPAAKPASGGRACGHD